MSEINSLVTGRVSLLACLFAASLLNAEESSSSDQSDLQNGEVITVVSTRGTIAYVSAAGTKDETPIIETPISVSVLTQQRIEDLGAETVQDALGYVSGVFNGPFGVDTRGDWSVVRAVSPVQYLDGMKMLYGYYNNTRPNPYSLGQIEILKGPASVLYGQGTTGGIVNLLSKRPEAETAAEVWSQIGNFNRRQLAFDYTGAVNSDASVLMRVTGMTRASDTQTDFVDDDTTLISPAVTFFLGSNTEWTLLSNYQKNESGSSTQFFPHIGTVRPAPFGQIPVERFVSEPGFDRYDTEQTSLTSILDYDIDGEWSAHWSARYMDSQAEYRTMYAYPFALQADNRNLLRSIYMADKEAESLTSDLRLHGQFNMGTVSHDFVIGLDYQTVDLSEATLFAFGQGGFLDVYDPEYGLIDLSVEPDFNSFSAGTLEQTGVYLQDQMKLDQHWILSLGMRQDDAKTGSYKNPENDYSVTTRRIGIMHAFNNGIHPYISFSESFDLISGVDANGNLLKPKEGEQREVGIKYQPLGSAHLITFAAFDTVEKNRIKQIIVDGQPQLAQVGEASIKGIELEAQLEWDTLDVYASFTQLSKAQDENDLDINAVPETMLSVWTTYRPDTFWEGVKLGGGMRYVGKTNFLTMIENTPMPYTTDSYFLFDLLLGYEFDAFDLSLNVDNVTDKTTITACLDRGDCFYGQKRTVTANLRYHF
ncbi:TonB-dependent siderophore receptor [Pleionea sediminis]|uniref:TonB-dependent siderophore receptor n=1 Tax=Pleionea sediminis TaxID=2569479 RepID=UPI001186A330|nr:TonB-dependent siderophore receptor [Pleionea sediminis]